MDTWARCWSIVCYSGIWTNKLLLCLLLQLPQLCFAAVPTLLWFTLRTLRLSFNPTVSNQGTFYCLRKNNQYARPTWARWAAPPRSQPAWWHLARAGEASRTPRLISVRAKWQRGLSVASHTSSASPKIRLDSVLSFPSDKPQLSLPPSHTQPIRCVTSRL